MKTEITELLGIEYPIIQGGMAWVAEYHLAAAVSEAGGLGIIGAASAPPEWVRDQIQKAKKMTDKPFGVNIMLMSPYADEIAKVIVEEKVKVVTTGAGSPEKYMQMWKEADVKVIPIAVIIMLFAIPYCATQSFLVNYAQIKHLGISVSMFFPVYAIVLMVLRLTLKKWFDRWSFRTFLIGGLVCASLSIIFLAVMENNAEMLMAAAFMAGGYGIMCSVCQSNAILVAGKGRRGLANSTYYMGLDLGMTLGPVIGGMLMGNISVKWFYPDLLVTIPLCFLVYVVMKIKRQKY